MFDRKTSARKTSIQGAPSHGSGFDLKSAALKTLQQYGFEPQFPTQVTQQLETIVSQSPASAESVRDLRGLPWSSIDNDTSRDLDQVELAQALPDGSWKVMVAIADVDAYVAKGTPIDEHAAKETTTVYTGVQTFPMLPEQLSTGLTSLLEGQDRLAMVTEFVVRNDGHLGDTDVYRARVRNQAQLTYAATGAWLEDRGPEPVKISASPELEQQLRAQNQIAQALKGERFRHGALSLESVETNPVMSNGDIAGIANQQRNLATELIEEFMIAANEVIARTLKSKGVSSIRRIVRTPKRWDRIVELAAQQGTQLPAEPDSKALNDFLTAQQAADPGRFADLSLAVVKLMGPGEYQLESANGSSAGHFGLAVQDYTHSTAPNRRFADLVTQRIVKAVISGAPPPYRDDELNAIAENCTKMGDGARKVERAMAKRIAAVALSSQIGNVYDAIVTGVNQHGTFVRTFVPHAEGLLVQGQGVDVGDKLRVRLVRVDVGQAYIDFARA